MGGQGERKQPVTETFGIPEDFRRAFRNDYPIAYLVPKIIDHYLENEEQWVRERLNKYCQKPHIHQFLITEMERKNESVIRNGKIHRGRPSITIPTSIAFYRSVFPTLRVTGRSVGQARINPNLGVLTELGRVEYLETIVWTDTNVDFIHLSPESRRLVAEAMHTFRIYTATSIHNPHPQGVPNDNLERLVAAIRVFQLEYIELDPDEDANLLGRINRITLLGMNRALAGGGWWRRQFFEDRNIITGATRYFVHLGVIPITPRFNMQGNDARNATSGNWGGNTFFIPGTRLPMQTHGCAVALVSNIAFTHIHQGRGPSTLAANAADIRHERDRNPGWIADRERANANRFFSDEGIIDWDAPLRGLGVSLAANINRTGPGERTVISEDGVETVEQYTHVNERFGEDVVNAFNTRMRNDTASVYFAIDVNVAGTLASGDSSGQHFVGASELVTLDDSIQYFRISPTSQFDWIMGTTSLNNRRGRGWRVLPNEQTPEFIYVPVSQVKGYRIFRIERNQ